MLRRHTGERHRDIRRIHTGLARLYTAWGRPDQAAAHRRVARPELTPY